MIAALALVASLSSPADFDVVTDPLSFAADVAATGALGSGAIGGGGGGGGTFNGGNVTNPIKLAAGACPSPSLSFTAASTTGNFLLSSTIPSLGWCVGGVLAGRLDFGSPTEPTGVGNTSFGYSAGSSLTANVSTNNTLVGAESGPTLTGNQNTCVGSRTCNTATSSNQLTCVGQGACFAQTGSFDVAMGFHAGLNNVGSNNTFLGHQAAEGAVSTNLVSNATAVGYQAGQNLTSATATTLVGFQAGHAVTSGGANTLVGFLAGTALDVGANNVVVGREALKVATGVSDDVVVGQEAGLALAASNNVLVGSLAGFTLTSGATNTMIGFESGGVGTTCVTCANVTLIGDNTTTATNSQSNATALGHGAIAPADNSVQLGNTSVVLLSKGNGVREHFSTPTSYASGTCTGETGTGDEHHGTVTATCTAQTWIVLFSSSYTNAPVCTVSAMNAAASAGAATFTYVTATTGITATVTTATTGGLWSFTCEE